MSVQVIAQRFHYIFGQFSFAHLVQVLCDPVLRYSDIFTNGCAYVYRIFIPSNDRESNEPLRIS
jgi:hypothetical protein